MEQDLTGQRLGQYEILEPISTQHPARVYRARQMILERDVALKALPLASDDTGQDARLRRFYDEARVVARLNHQHIVPVHDFGEEHDWAFIVMEFVREGTVRDRIHMASRDGQLLDLAWTLSIATQAASALAYAHAQGVVHRDVKPANMLLRSRDTMLLSDFGIALLADSGATPGISAEVVGTPHYMAPEQATLGAKVDARSDIYALGASLYHCVTGAFPFEATNAVELLAKQVHQPLVPPRRLVPTLPSLVEAIICKAMEKDPARRYQQASEMEADLRLAREDTRATGRYAVPAFVASGLRAPTSLPIPAGTGARCARCGEMSPAANHFCTRCGYDFRAQPVPLPPGVPPVRLVFANGPLARARAGILMTAPSVRLGRGSGNDLIIEERSVSRAGHARVFTAYGGWFVEDLGSSGGTYLNEQEVTTPRELMPQDILRFGDVEARFEVVA